jgi:prepilin peptidase CpaA
MNKFISFQDGLLVFRGDQFIELKTVILLFLLLIATAYDFRSRRIPNWLVFGGSVIGLLYQPLPFYSAAIVDSLQGLAAGLIALLPLYMMRAMGAGDVKLMAMVGAFLGWSSALGAVLMTLIAGGVLGIAAAIWSGSLRQTFRNIQFILTHAAVRAASGTDVRIDPLSASSMRMPYALAIAAGSVIHLVLLRAGYALVS